jgi:DHA1 family multidrug resistance protein-like MFS transporter
MIHSKYMTAERSILYVTIFLLNMGMGIRPALLGVIKAEFGIPVLQVGMLTSSFAIARLLISLPSGMLVDRLSAHRLLLGGALGILAGSALSGFAATFPSLLLGQSLIGLGFGLFATTAQVCLARLTSPEDRGTTFSLYAASFFIAGTLSPVIGGGIASVLGWRVAFFFSVLMAGLALAFLLAGLGRLAPAATTSLIEDTSRNHGEEASTTSVPPLQIDWVSFGAMSLVSYSLFFVGLSFAETILPVYGASVLRLDPASIGVVMGLGGAMRVVMNLLCGTLSDKYGRRNVIMPELIVLGLSFLFLRAATGLFTFGVSAMLTGVGRVGNSLVMALVADQMPPPRWGTLISINRGIGDLGLLLGPIVLGWLADRSGYDLVTVFCAALAWLSAAVMAVTIKESSHPLANQTC